MTTALRKSSNGGLRRLFGNGSFPSMPQEMEDLFDRFGFERNWPVLDSATGTVPALDLSETESSVDVKLDIPGFKSDDIDIQIRGGLLTISGSKKEEKEEKGRSYHRIERTAGSFARSVTLPCNVVEKDAKAEYKDGVLSLTIPKTEPVKATKVAVKAGS